MDYKFIVLLNYQVIKGSFAFSLRTGDVFSVVASLPPKNNVCDLELQHDFREVSVY